MATQRLRLSYGRTGALRYLAHLDMIRLWHLLFRRSGIPLAYSEGRNPRPRISIAAALPVGVTSEGEFLDVFLRRRISGFYFLKRIEPRLLANLDVYGVDEVGIESPSLQSLVRESEYRVRIECSLPDEELEATVGHFLAAQTFPWEHRRDKEVRSYDLRPQVHDLWVEKAHDDGATIGMLLQTDPAASGRPEQVAAALGFGNPPIAIHRSRVVLAEPEKHGDRRVNGRS